MRGTALVFPVFVLYAVTIGRVSMTATDAALIALGERFEKLLLEHMDAWLEWAPRMRAAHAEVRDNKAALAVAIQHTGCDVAQAHMSELERDMQPLAEEIIAAPATSLAGLRAKALVALWEALPANASHDGAFDFPDASRAGMRLPACLQALAPPWLMWWQVPKQNGRMETHCLAGHVRLELRNVATNYPFESSIDFPGIKPNSGRRDLRV